MAKADRNPVQPEPRLEPQNPIHSAIDTVFRNDESIREGMSNNLRERSTESLSLTNRAQDAFAGFSPSRRSAAERARPNYLGPGDDLAASLEAVLIEGAKALERSTVPRSIRLRPTEALQSLIKVAKGRDGLLVGTIDLEHLVNHIAPNSTVRPSRPMDPTFTTCMAELDAEKRLKEIQEELKEKELKAIRGSAAESAAGDVSGTTPGHGDTSPSANRSAGDTSAAADTLVKDEVSLLMKTVRSPESQVLYAVPNRPDQSALQDNISTFELRLGPSDVTSYHDFSSLQIAFAHVWAEIFDGQLSSLGKELYSEYVKLKVFAGIDDGADRPVNTLDDLSQLMDEIRNLAKITKDATPGDFRPSGHGAGSSTPDASADATAIVKKVLDPASLITDNIGDPTLRALLDPASAIIDAISKLLAGTPQITWKSFPGPLPGNRDTISVEFVADAVKPGEVEIVLKNSPVAWWWKGIEFTEFDAAGKTISHFTRSNDPGNNVLSLYTTQLKNALLEFSKAVDPGGVHTNCFLLAGLGDRIKDGMRVTFTWEKDA